MSLQLWADIGAVLVVLGTILAFGKKIGNQEQKMKQIEVKIGVHESTLELHTAQLAQGAGNFRVIDEKLTNLGKGQDEMKEGQKEIRDLLVQHLTVKP